jgi:MFS family permease
MQFVVLMGLVSLFADACYEGARSAVGPYLGHLGASATAVGLIAGTGELVGYGLRYVTGRIADRTRAYWTLAILGYGINMAAVPTLALVGGWHAAAMLVVLERLGKAVRNPSGSVLLSFAAEEVGHGRAFGIHEAMDQAGAIVGPLAVAGVLWWKGGDLAGYRWAFGVLAIPAVLTMISLLSARARYADPSKLVGPAAAAAEPVAFGRGFTLYMIAVALIGCGLADWALLAFHLDKRGIAGDALVPVLYAAAMAADGGAALVVGGAFDRARKRGGAGLSVLAVTVLAAAASLPLVLLGGTAAALAGIALWAVGLGAVESIGKATVSALAPKSRRGAAFGLYYAVFGGAWWVGSIAIGWLSDRSRVGASVFGAASLVVAAAVLFAAEATIRRGAASEAR